MSILSKFRKAKQAADSQKDKNVAAAESKEKVAPYRHVPTHAATDALLGAPATWREQDKKAIQAQHKRKSQSHLSRNPSSLSNVTTLNHDQSFTSRDYVNAAADRRKHYSLDRAATTKVARMSQLAPFGSTSTSPLKSQFPSMERSSAHTSMGRSRFDTTETAPPVENAMERVAVRPYTNGVSPPKDVKFYLPSSRGEFRHGTQSVKSIKLMLSHQEFRPAKAQKVRLRHHKTHHVSTRPPAPCSIHLTSSLSVYDPTFPAPVPLRHPQRPVTLEAGQPHKKSNPRIVDVPRLPTVPPTPDPCSSTNPVAESDSDLSFINFGQNHNPQMGDSSVAL